MLGLELVDVVRYLDRRGCGGDNGLAQPAAVEPLGGGRKRANMLLQLGDPRPRGCKLTERVGDNFCAGLQTRGIGSRPRLIRSMTVRACCLARSAVISAWEPMVTCLLTQG